MYQMMQTLQASKTAQSSRIGQAITPISRVPRVKTSSVNYTDTLKFVQNYGKGMSDVKLSAAKLQSGNASNVFSSVDMKSSDASVAQVDKTFRPIQGTEISLEVQSLASAQQNRSQAVDGAEAAQDGSSMNFQVTSSGGKSVQVNVSDTAADGTKRTNEQMYQKISDTLTLLATGGDVR